VPWTLTVREGPRTRRERFDTVDAAVDALEIRLAALRPRARRASTQALTRTYTPGQQVAARGEIAGPNRLVARWRAGADLRGDGSVEAYTGRLQRTVVARQQGESPYDALRRTLRERGAGG